MDEYSITGIIPDWISLQAPNCNNFEIQATRQLQNCFIVEKAHPSKFEVEPTVPCTFDSFLLVGTPNLAILQY
jgi:hypothetical protein